MARIPQHFEQDVFINCPFDPAYAPLFEAIIFAVHACGLVPRCALEKMDAGRVRIDKITQLISECKYSIHDLSRTESDVVSALPRFNMPLELGIDLGCRRFGKRLYQQKSFLILDTESYRYQKFISDIAGQDISVHGGQPEHLIRIVRDWLRTDADRENLPSGKSIFTHYRFFRQELPDLCEQLGLSLDQLLFVDFSYLVTYWLREHPLKTY